MSDSPRPGFPFWLLPLIASWAHAAWLYSVLPATVPVHWGLNGQIDRYGSRAEAAFLLPCIMLFVGAVMALATYRRGSPQILAVVTLTFMFAVQLVCGYAFQHGQLPQLAFGANPLWVVLPLGLGWAYAGWLYTRLPAVVPMHWGLDGQVDRYGGPAQGAFLLPGIFTGMLGVMYAISDKAPLLLLAWFFLALQVGVSVAQLKHRAP
jgi:uncharacterized membrane protein